jgi:hypothetical protein
MSTVRLNITLPADVADALKGTKNKSAYIAKALKEKMEKEKKEKLRTLLKKGYRATNKEDEKLDEEWDTATGDGID